MKKTGMQVRFCFICLSGRLLVNTTWAQRSFQIQTTQLCKHIPELNKKAAAKHTSTDACVHIELKMCTNCGQIHRRRSIRAFPNTLTCASTQRGVMCRAGLWKAAIWENTSQSKQKAHKANACSTVQGSTPRISREREQKTRVERSDGFTPDTARGRTTGK